MRINVFLGSYEVKNTDFFLTTRYIFVSPLDGGNACLVHIIDALGLGRIFGITSSELPKNLATSVLLNPVILDYAQD